MNTMRMLFSIAACAVLCGCGSSEDPATPAAISAAPTATQHQREAPAVAAQVRPAVPLLEQQLAYGEAARINLVGYLAMPQDAAEPLPGIIVIHEASGLNDDIKAMTRRLASEGYVALAVDLYGGKTAATSREAQALVGDLYAEPEATRHNLQQAYDYLEKYAFAPRVASIGWDLGGGWSLQMALLYPSALDAAVMYYGQVLKEPDRLASLNVPVLGFFGADDKSIPMRDVQGFRAQLLELGKNAEILIMPRTDHGFANPSGATYDERVANETWASTLAFLERHLKLDTPAGVQ